MAAASISYSLLGLLNCLISGRQMKRLARKRVVYTTKEGVRKHMVRHSGERKFVCDLCGKRFMHPFDLSKHKKSSIHNGKCFKRRDDVKHHITRVHPKTMGLQRANLHCSLCDKVYTTKEGLIKHMVRHSGERKFVCDLCGKRFMHPFDLSKHKKSSIHNGK
uniref:C2H2-type domain-containing protein n=1 Tax=Timema poppense TaxID=170557 RepID=A0A7R9H9W0_TIMPO|nr:unnamed protein product [Timema poppensis]